MVMVLVVQESLVTRLLLLIKMVIQQQLLLIQKVIGTLVQKTHLKKVSKEPLKLKIQKAVHQEKAQLLVEIKHHHLHQRLIQSTQKIRLQVKESRVEQLLLNFPMARQQRQLWTQKVIGLYQIQVT